MKDYSKYQSQEWVNVQQDTFEDENSTSIMDDFKTNIMTTSEIKNFLNSNLDRLKGKKFQFNCADITRAELRSILNNTEGLSIVLSASDVDMCESNLSSLNFAIKYNFDTVKLFKHVEVKQTVCEDKELMHNAVREFGIYN